MKLRTLTPKQKDAFDFIRSEIASKRVPPTYQEISTHLGLASKGRAHRIVQVLEEKGFVITGTNHARGIALVGDAAAYTIRLDPTTDRRLHDYVAAWGSTPETVIAQALSAYLGRAA